MLSNLFIESIQDAVTQSTTNDLCLVVYITDSNQSNDSDKWLKKWFQLDNIAKLKSMAIWLRIFNGSQELQYFEQIFPGVVIPSLYLIYKGQIKLLLMDDPNVTDDTIKNYWNQLFDCLHSCTPRMNTSSIDQRDSPSSSSLPTSSDSSNTNNNIKPSKGNKKTFRQQVEETTQQLYREKIEKERRLDREERDRILRLVKADRKERKAREHELHSRIDNVATTTVNDNNDLSVHDNIKNEELLHSVNCILQIKLTNGKSIRHTFDHKDTLNDVRKWVDLNRTDSHVPYAFHRSMPRYTFQESDELESLESLELTPRSLLILKPLETSTNKLNTSDIENPGLFGRVYNTFSAFWGGYSNNTDGNNKNLNDNQLNPLDMRSMNNSDLSLNDNSIITTRFDTSIFGNRYSNNNNSNTTNNNNNISRSLTPNVFHFFNTDTNDNNSDDDSDKEKETYNGNNIKLEKRKDD
ncbi:hypothetical protein RI543_003183 [Arxiozyma heterogenica]|uniref:UBX domain-containing protein n=1 Tax=Arxiozyma heterogenica TaxID=278026 RepID=A0AAN7WSM9_9SACH|nr:hypothetical protein RI543_003183 [Kazachstania heterogenica]